MRPLYLEIEGVKSISDKQIIDFERVSKTGIFGVFGKTGSGKTTILDSIVLALYGTVTSSVDNKDFINQGCLVAKVNLLFSVTGVKGCEKFRVERIYKFDKKRQNVTSNAKLWQVLESGEYCVEEGTSKVNSKLEKEIIGLNKDDFLKCIALPQGAFSDFLKLKRVERLSFVGKLFGLEKYGKPLADKISFKLNQLKNQEATERGKLSAYENCNEQAVENAKNKLEEKQEEYEKAKIEKNEKKAEFEKLKNLYDLAKELKKKNEKYKEKLANESFIKRLEGEISQLEKVLSVEKEIAIFNKASEEKEDRTKKIAEQEKLQIKLQERKTRAEEEQKLIPALNEKLTAANVKREKIKEISPKIALLDEKNKKLIALRDEYRIQADEQKKLLQKLEECKKEGEKYKALAEKIDVKGALARLEKGAVKEFAFDVLQTLSQLSDLLKKEELKNESAINRLIEAQIQVLHELLSQEGDKMERSLLKECVDILDESAKYVKLAHDNETEYEKTNEKIVSLNGKLADNKVKGVELKKETDELQAEINSVLDGKTVAEAIKDIEREIKNLQERIESISKELELIAKEETDGIVAMNSLKDALLRAEKDLADAEKAINCALSAIGIDKPTALKILEKRRAIEQNRAIAENYRKDLYLLQTDIGNLNEQLKDGAPTEEEFEKASDNYREIEEKVEKIAKNLGEINSEYKNILKNNDEWCIINKTINSIVSEKTVYLKVLSLVERSRFMEFIAEVYLREIAREAENRVLSLTSGRYGLVYKDGNFFVTDNLGGGNARTVNSLSGGETFLVSLSLALALSSQISRKALKKLDFFFLDEGFGTLDDDLIDAVAQSLENLQRSNLTVGLITHVNELKNRIASRIEVTGATALHGTLITDNCG